MGKKFRENQGLEKNYLSLIKWGAYLILFTPLIIHKNFYFPFVGLKSLYFMGLVEIIFFSWLFLILFSKKFRPHFNPILGSLILFLIILIISVVLGVDPFNSFWSKYERMTGILMMFHLFAFFLVISSTFEKEDWQKIFNISIFVGVIISFIALTSKNPTMRGGATIGNDSFLGTYLLFNLFLALYLIITSKEGLRTYSSICFSIIFLALLLSGARAAKFSFLGGLILLFFFWLIFYQKGKLRLVGISLFTLSLLVVICFTFFSFQPESFVRKEIIERLVVQTFGGRFVVWQKAWENFLERPLFGWGPENFGFAFSKNYNSCLGAPPCGSDIWYDRAHNIIFDTLVTSGIFGMLAYFGIFISTFYLLWKNYFQKNLDFWIPGIFTVLLISYSIQNLTVFDMVSSYMMFFLILGFFASFSFKTEENVILERKPPHFLIGIILLILFIFSFSKFIIKPALTDYYVISVIKSPLASEKRLNYYKKALETSPLGKYQIRDFFGEITLEDIQSEKIKEVSPENFKKEIDFIINELEKTTKECPIDFRSHLTLGKLYNIYAIFLDPSKILLASQILENAIELSPANQQGYWALAQTRLLENKPQEALLLVEKSIALAPALKQSHIIIINIAKAIGDYDLAKKKIEEALKIDPSWEPELKNILGG